MRQLKIYLFVIILCLLTIQQLISQTLPKANGASSVGTSASMGVTEAASLNGKDFSGESQYSGDVSFSVPLATMGSLDVQLSYNSNIHKPVRGDNNISPTGLTGLGWSMEIGSITAEISNTPEVWDDKYYYSDQNGRTEIMQPDSGVFILQNYKMWKITRKLNESGFILGWEIIKEDGTIMRFGNYNKDTQAFIVSPDGPTYATRCYLGFNGWVSNPDVSYYDSAAYIPYQWDVSDVQEVGGKHTTITYQQINKQLVVSGVQITSKYYTRESHVQFIKDNMGGEVEFVLDNKYTEEYFGNFPSYTQNLYECKYLDRIKLKRNLQIYQQVVLTYDTMDVLQVNAKKRYLKGIQTQDASGNGLPTTKFEYCGYSDVNQGALKRITYPTGGKVEYTYQAQRLDNNQLYFSTTTEGGGTHNNFADLSYLSTTGMCGKDFFAVLERPTNRIAEQYGALYTNLKVYRLEATGWCYDSTFRTACYNLSDSVCNCIVGNDYIFFSGQHEDVLVKRTETGWVADSAIQTKVGTFRVQPVGQGPNFFVFKYNGRRIDSVNYFDIGVIRILPYGIKIDYVDTEFSDDFTATKPYPDQGGSIYYYPAWFFIKAYCGANYFVVQNSLLDHRSFPYSSHYIESQYKWQSGQWTRMVNKKCYYYFGDDPAPSYTINNNFVTCFYATLAGAANRYTIVYRHMGNTLIPIDTLISDHVVIGAFASDYYYGVKCRNDFSNKLRAWKNSYFSDVNNWISSSALYLSASGVRNRLLCSYMIAPHNYLKVDMIDSNGVVTSETYLDEMYGLGEEQSATVLGTNYTGYNTYLTEWKRILSAPTLTTLRSVTMVGEKPYRITIDSSAIGEHEARFWQAGNNFFTSIFKHWNDIPGTPGYTYAIDTLHISSYISASDTNGNPTFTGNPFAYNVKEKRTISGMGDTAITTYNYENGVYDESFTTAKYNKVTVNYPGNNRTVTWFYNDLGQGKAIDFVNANNWKELDGMPYKSCEYSGNTLIKETNTLWSADDIYYDYGVFFKKMVKDSTIIDGVSRVTNYEYNDSTQCQVSKITEMNSDGVKRITQMKYPKDYYTTTSSNPTIQALDSMKVSRHIWNAVVEKWITQDSAGQTKVFAAQLMKYGIFSNGVLPLQSYGLRTTTPVTNFTVSARTGDTLGYDSRYVVQQTFDTYDANGNLQQQTDANNIPTTTKWGYSSVVPVATFVNATNAQTFMDDFGGETVYNGWTMSESDGDTYWCISDGMLQQVDAGIASNEENDRLMRDNGSEITGNVVFEFDLRIADSDNWDFTIGAGGNLWTGGNGGSENPIWTAINNETWYYMDNTSTWRTIKSGLVVGKTYHFKIIGKCGTGKADYYVDGIRCVKDGAFRMSTTGIQKIAFGNYGYCTTPTTTIWNIDNVRLYPDGAVAKSQSYIPTFLAVNQTSDENGNIIKYAYDSFGRPTSIQDYQGTTLKDIAYYYSRTQNGDTLKPSDPNYTQQRVYRSGSDTTITKSYTDGLGRKRQTQILLSTDDIIGHITYDSLGRVSKSYKPYQYAAGHLYDAEANVNTHATNYYNSNVYSGFTDSAPFTIQEYYDRERPKNLKPEGSEWQSGHYVQYAYGKNNGSETGYSENTLNKTTTIDENGNKVVKYADKFGNLVQTVNDSSSTGLHLTTNFKYDVLRNLIQSIPPLGDAYKSSYSYNTLNQLTQKISPDAGTVQYLYDKAGNIRLVKDANHTAAITNNVNSGLRIITYPSTGTYSFTLNLGGKVTVGAQRLSGSLAITVSIKTTNGAVLYSMAYGGPTMVYGYVTLPKGSYICEGKPQGSGDYGYSVSCTKGYELIYNKYDALNRIIEQGEYESNVVTSFTQANADNVSFPTSSTLITKKYIYDTVSTNPLASGQRNVKGRISETDAYRLGALCVQTFYSYDQYGRVEWDVQSGLGSYPKKLYYWYDLQGNITKKGYVDLQGSYNMYSLYTYDKAGRLSTVQDSSSAGKVQDASYAYFASSKPSSVTLGSAATVTYNYNQRDWLFRSTSSKFYEHIGYNSQDEIGSTQNASLQWNGNISWQTCYMNESSLDYKTTGWTYAYDNINRLKGGKFGYNNGTWNLTNAYKDTNYVYDYNGNIDTLKRNDSLGNVIDNLGYNYVAGTNRLASITNSVGPVTQTYTYDANGNVISDSYRGIAFIIYNINNLPISVYPTNGYSQMYSYDVTGNRVQKYASNGTNTYYINNPAGQTEVVQKGTSNNTYTYNILGNDNLGQITIASSTINRFYYLKDHLGDVKMIVNSGGGVDSWNDYYPFGMQMDGRCGVASADARYKYVGMERDAETSTDYNHDRTYSFLIGRSFQPDPFADKDPSRSPYSYAGNNPIIFIDKNGDSVVVAYSSIPGSEEKHTSIIWVNEKTGQMKNIAEGQPENPWTGRLTMIGEAISETVTFGDVLSTWDKGNGFGNLVKDIEMDPYEVDPKDMNKVSIPEGQTEEGFVKNIRTSFNSYKDDVKYSPTANTDNVGNSNSLTGSVLRKSGSNYIPIYPVAGWYRNILPEQKRK